MSIIDSDLIKELKQYKESLQMAKTKESLDDLKNDVENGAGGTQAQT